MKKLTLALLTVVIAGAVVFRLRAQSDRTALSPQLDFGVTELVRAQPFTLAEPYAHEWRADGGQVAAGHLVVLRVDPARARAVQELAPVLYAGDEVLERVNYGDSGVVVGVVPSALTSTGSVALDLGETPFWFGAPELPERVDAAWIATERASADRAGLRAPSPEEVVAARSFDDEVLALEDRTELQIVAAGWILEHAPEEAELAQSLLAPAVR